MPKPTIQETDQSTDKQATPPSSEGQPPSSKGQSVATEFTKAALTKPIVSKGRIEYARRRDMRKSYPQSIQDGLLKKDYLSHRMSILKKQMRTVTDPYLRHTMVKEMAEKREQADVLREQLKGALSYETARSTNVDFSDRAQAFMPSELKKDQNKTRIKELELEITDAEKEMRASYRNNEFVKAKDIERKIIIKKEKIQRLIEENNFARLHLRFIPPSDPNVVKYQALTNRRRQARKLFTESQHVWPVDRMMRHVDRREKVNKEIKELRDGLHTRERALLVANAEQIARKEAGLPYKPLEQTATSVAPPAIPPSSATLPRNQPSHDTFSPLEYRRPLQPKEYRTEEEMMDDMPSLEPLEKKL